MVRAADQAWPAARIRAAPESQRFLGSRPMSGRKLAFLAPISWIAGGVAILAMPFVFEAKDEFGLLFGLAFGATCLGTGAFQLWRLKNDDPRTTAYTVVELPLEQRASVV